MFVRKQLTACNVPYREDEEELPYYNEIEYYEEIVFTDYSVKSYSWG